MHLRLASWRERLRGSLWFIPALSVLAVCLLAVGTLALDHRAEETGFVGFTGSPDGASTMLSTIAGAIVTLTALVFSVTVVALQLASSQYSPRVLRSFLRDRLSQMVLGSFLSTFAYTMIVLRSVRTTDVDAITSFVPAISVHVAFGLSGLSLAFFVLYIHHISQSMQASVIVANVARETREALERLHPRAGDDAPVSPAVEWRPPESPASVKWDGPSGYLQAADESNLLAEACRLGAIIHLVPRPGDFVATGAIVLEMWQGDPRDLDEPVETYLTVGRERNLQQDAAFGFRQLVDIAERALSPGLNDPTTAVQAADRIYELLLLLADREIPSPLRTDDAGALRLVLDRPGWDDYVHLAFDEIRHYGEGSIQLSRRLHAVLRELVETVPADRQTAVQEQLDLLERAIDRGLADGRDRAWVTGGLAVPSAGQG